MPLRQVFLNPDTKESQELFAKALMAAANRHKTPHINISFSLLSMFKSCPRQAMLRLILPEAPQNQAPFIGGSVSHKLIEYWGTQTNYEPGWMQENVIRFYEEFEAKQEILKYRNYIGAMARNEWGCSTDREFQIEKARRCVIGFEQIAARLNLKRHGARFERWMSKKIGTSIYNIKGSVDIYDPITNSIYDVKASATPGYGDPLQLKMYAFLTFLIDKQMPAKAQFLLPILDDPFKLAVIPDGDTNKEVLAIVGDFIRHIQAGDFPVTPSSQACYTCSYKGSCPVFGGVFKPEDHLQ